MVRFNGRRLIFVRYIGLDLKGRIFLRFFLVLFENVLLIRDMLLKLHYIVNNYMRKFRDYIYCSTKHYSK